MSRETDADGTASGDSAESTSSTAVFDRELLSDLFVNAVPILIVVVFLLVFTVQSPLDGGSDPLWLFHGALIGGVVLVSIVAGWVIRNEDQPLEGTAGRRDDSDDD